MQYDVGLPIWLPPAITALGLALLLGIPIGCAGLNDREQREVSGAAIGGMVAGPVGAALGVLVGFLVDLGHDDENE